MRQIGRILAILHIFFRDLWRKRIAHLNFLAVSFLAFLAIFMGMKLEGKYENTFIIAIGMFAVYYFIILLLYKDKNIENYELVEITGARLYDLAKTVILIFIIVYFILFAISFYKEESLYSIVFFKAISLTIIITLVRDLRFIFYEKKMLVKKEEL